MEDVLADTRSNSMQKKEGKKIGKKKLVEIACSKEMCGSKKRARKERKENKQRVVSWLNQAAKAQMTCY
jgi:hypothetical protein